MAHRRLGTPRGQQIPPTDHENPPVIPAWAPAPGGACPPRPRLRGARARAKTIELLNVSYDPTRELYVDYNAAFAKYWKAKTGDDVVIKQSHGGSGAQARSVIDGLQADVVTLALAYDIDASQCTATSCPRTGRSRLPDNSTPYTSTIVFLVRKGNPKDIKDWDDLVRARRRRSSRPTRRPPAARAGPTSRPGATPSASTAARTRRATSSRALYKNVPVLDSGARGSTITFAQNEIGDVLLAWENEAFLAQKEFGDGKFEIVIPSSSILAEPPVAVVDKVAERKGTARGRQGLPRVPLLRRGPGDRGPQFLPARATPAIAAKYAGVFPKLDLFTIDERLRRLDRRRRRPTSPTAASSTRSTRNDRRSP